MPLSEPSEDFPLVLVRTRSGNEFALHREVWPADEEYDEPEQIVWVAKGDYPGDVGEWEWWIAKSDSVRSWAPLEVGNWLTYI